MPLPRSLAAYSDCESDFERALDAPNGIAITLDSPAIATRYAQKLNTFRTHLRANSKEVYTPEDKRYGTCPYDHFAVTKDPEDPARLLIRPYVTRNRKVEELPPPEEGA